MRPPLLLKQRGVILQQMISAGDHVPERAQVFRAQHLFHRSKDTGDLAAAVENLAILKLSLLF